ISLQPMVYAVDSSPLRPHLLLLKPKLLKLQRSAVFANGAYGRFVEAFRPACLDFQRDFDLGADQPAKVLQHFLDNGADLAVDALGVEGDAAVVARGASWRRGSWGRDGSAVLNWRRTRLYPFQSLRHSRLFDVLGMDQQAALVKVDG